MNKQSAERSPLKDKPLRLPGQSVQEERDKIVDDVNSSMIQALMIIVLALLEWYRWFISMPPAPAVYTAAAVLAIVWAYLRFRKVKPRLRALRLAADGEKAVGQFLEKLRSEGFQVFHDVVGDNFNVDHILIGPQGVFTVETKTWNKPKNFDARVIFDGVGIKVGQYSPDRDVAVQAKAQASWMQRLLLESAGRTVSVRPVVLFPGWFVENTSGFGDLWVLEPKALPAFIRRQPALLGPEDVKLLSFHLSRYVRTASVVDA